MVSKGGRALFDVGWPGGKKKKEGGAVIIGKGTDFRENPRLP